MHTISNLTKTSGSIDKELREGLLKQKAITYWITGLSGSGKSTLAYGLEETLFNQGKLCYVLDGDNIRYGLNQNLGFSSEDRSENIRRIAEVSRLMNDAGLIVITAFITPFNADRHMAKQIIGESNYCEIYLSTSLAVCESRDPKGLYQKARSGQLPHFTGVSSPYEVPLSPDFVIDTNNLSLNQSINLIIEAK